MTLRTDFGVAATTPAEALETGASETTVATFSQIHPQEISNVQEAHPRRHRHRLRARHHAGPGLRQGGKHHGSTFNANGGNGGNKNSGNNSGNGGAGGTIKDAGKAKGGTTANANGGNGGNNNSGNNSGNGGKGGSISF